MLRCALNAMPGASDRWDALRKSGASDDDLFVAISYVWGHGEFSSKRGSWECSRVRRSVGYTPAFRCCRAGGYIPDRRWITGQKLIDLVRETLAIPQPGEIVVEVETGR